MMALHAFVDGRVQGVWFRQSTREQAENQRLQGWVRNLADGRVEVWLQGEAVAVHHVETWLYSGPELAVVTEVIVEEVSPDLSLNGFEVLDGA
ncbi:acylphosphatase [Pokkaliibacter plantistimulans]|uniref:Acylphosphatase n=1 Tax=Pokkaliibacter plantistimulans TaxID=1635171 RepID=A0ABX5LX66_9GAMM|nr:acylphosphatase [Pokkaliibacter plantistimulans]PXF31209.1 acylphosphatase [Pokkaliibacter plantistimulans]